MRVLYEQWGYSILHKSVSSWFQSEDVSCINKALSLCRRGFKFYRLKYQFYFDCFYLTEVFDKSLLDNLYVFLRESGSNLFTKSALKNTYRFFIGEVESLKKVEDELLIHRSSNQEFESKREKRVLVVATVSAGKSTLINAMIGYGFNKTKNGVCTTQICRIHNKFMKDGISLRNADIISYGLSIDSYNNEQSNEIAVHFESSLGKERICLIDTPGVNNSRDLTHGDATYDAIKAGNYDLIVCISNSQYNGTSDERRLLETLHTETKKPILFVLNQLDRFKKKEDDISKMVREYTRELSSIGFHRPQVFAISAQYALLQRRLEFLDEDELDEYNIMGKRFASAIFDLQSYSGKKAQSEIEKTGILALEEIIKTTPQIL